MCEGGRCRDCGERVGFGTRRRKEFAGVACRGCEGWKQVRDGIVDCTGVNEGGTFANGFAVASGVAQE